jgi:hypothetical protein
MRGWDRSQSNPSADVSFVRDVSLHLSYTDLGTLGISNPCAFLVLSEKICERGPAPLHHHCTTSSYYLPIIT